MYMFVKGAQMAFSVLPLYDMDVVGGWLYRFYFP